MSALRVPVPACVPSQAIAASVAASPEASAAFWKPRLPATSVLVSVERSSAIEANAISSSATSTTTSDAPRWRSGGTWRGGRFIRPPR